MWHHIIAMALGVMTGFLSVRWYFKRKEKKRIDDVLEYYANEIEHKDRMTGEVSPWKQ